MNDSNKCETSSTIRPSKPAKTKSNENETDQISLSSHVVNNVNSNASINRFSPISQTEAVHTQIQHYADAPYRLLRSYSTSTCSALYSPLLKGRKSNDLRFQQQKGRYSDTICSRYPKNISGHSFSTFNTVIYYFFKVNSFIIYEF